MAKKKATKKAAKKAARRPEPDVAEVEATDDEKRMAMVLMRGHYKGQPPEAQLSAFGGFAVRRRNAGIERLRKLSKGERDKFLDELDGKPAADAGDAASGEQGGDGDEREPSK